ncbi:HSP20-like chaperone [Daldinia sp. FL1419]|nr:HSP20-like chaperone [Daldinia sp. FL1419]
MENSNNNNNNQVPFWEFMQSFGPHGAGGSGVGIDHAGFGPQFPLGFPFDTTQSSPWGSSGWGRWTSPWGAHGGHGRDSHERHRDTPEDGKEEDHSDHEMESSSDTQRGTPDESTTGEVPPPPPPPPGAFPDHPPPPFGAFPHPHGPPPPGAPNRPFHRGRPHPFCPHRGRGGRYSRGGRNGSHGPPAYSGPWDFRPLMHAFATHPFAQTFRECMDQARGGFPGESNDHQGDAFVPPVDVFDTEKAYVLHVSLPGALKEDIGVNWDGEKVNIAGVVHRPGDEEFLRSLASNERKVGMFERSIKLPPPGSNEKEDIDGLGITAKMENGILIVTVPKTEKEWISVHKVDIE